MHEFNEAIEVDPAGLRIYILPNILEDLLDNHGVLVAQLRETFVHQRPDVDTGALDPDLREVLQVARLLRGRRIGLNFLRGIGALSRIRLLLLLWRGGRGILLYAFGLLLLIGLLELA